MSIATSIIGIKEVGFRLKCNFPVITRETSNKSSISCAKARVLRLIVSVARLKISSSNCRDINSCVHPNIAFKGVRNSWERVAKNSSLRRFASANCSARVRS